MTWELWPRDKGLGRTQDPLSGWSKLVLIERDNVPDTWTVTGPARTMSVFQPGMGLIVDVDGAQIVSGRVTSVSGGGSNRNGRQVEELTVGFASDLDVLGWRTVLPSPLHPLSPVINTMPEAYDTRTGTAETLLLGYIGAHAGAAASLPRRVARLRLPASQGRGGSTQVTGRLDSLGLLVRDLAEAGDLRVRVVHAEDAGGAWLDLVVDEVADLSDDVRFGSAGSASAGLISDWSYEISAPSVTRAIVAGAGELTSREFVQLVDADAEALWDMAVEQVVDQRHVDPDSADRLAEYTRAAQEALAEGAGPTKVSFTPTLGPDLVYRRDVRVGDVVGYDLPGLPPAAEKIRQATTTVVQSQGQATESVKVVVGTPDAPLTYPQRQAARALRAVSTMQRS